MFAMPSSTGKNQVARGADGRPDPQQKAVYAWEEEWLDWNRESLTIAEVRRWVRLACRAFKVPAPPVRQHGGNMISFSLVVTDEHAPLISFNRVHKNPAVALHEAAHYIVDRMFPNRRLDDHGPTWLGVYMMLLEMGEIAPRIALHATARAHGLRWRKPPRGAVRKRQKRVYKR